MQTFYTFGNIQHIMQNSKYRKWLVVYKILSLPYVNVFLYICECTSHSTHITEIGALGQYLHNLRLSNPPTMYMSNFASVINLLR